MKLSVELTLYPLQDGHLDIIRSTVARLNSYDRVKVRTFPTATIVVGDFEQVMGVVQDITRWSYEQHGRCAFVAKFLPGYEAD